MIDRMPQAAAAGCVTLSLGLSQHEVAVFVVGSWLGEAVAHRPQAVASRASAQLSLNSLKLSYHPGT